MVVQFSQNKTTNQQYQTTVFYSCPANASLPGLISSNFSFDFKLSAGFVYNLTAFCEIDRLVPRLWCSRGQVFDSSCCLLFLARACHSSLLGVSDL